MLPEKDTIDAIFSTVEALTQRQRKNSKSSWPKFKINLTSPPIIFSFLVPGSLLISALGLGVIGNWLGKQEFLLIPKLVLIALMYVSVFLGQIIDLLTDMKNVLIHVIGDAREYAATDAQHVNNFYKDEPQALTY